MADQTGMQPAEPQAAPVVPVVKQVKQLLSQDKIKEKFGEVLGQKAPQFMASITNTVSGSTQLKKCPANSIIGAAFVAATYDLPIDSNLGFAAIVPYNESVWNPKKKDWEKIPKAQFQMMYKGFIQLAIRSGYYERMNYAVVYKDELESYNPITGEIKFVEDFSNCKQRDAGDEANVAGYYAWFRLKTGYSQELYMSKKAVDNHARKYSQAYRYDLNKGKKSSKWTTDFEAMALKTVIKLLLSKWGILSVMPYSLWSAIALWCRKNGTMPRGNNNYGSDHGYPHEKGTPTYYDSNKIARVATGSGPDTWSHNWMPDGIFDLNGNVWEWCAGMRLVDGEIQIIPYANSMILTTSMAAGSTEWKAIAADGSLVAPGTAGTLKWDVVSGKIQLTKGTITPKDTGNWLPYNNMTLGEGLTAAPELAKALLLYPDEPNGDYGGDYHGLNTSGERLPICGGSWNYTSGAGVFGVNLNAPRTYAYGGLGFRSAFVN